MPHGDTGRVKPAIGLLDFRLPDDERRQKTHNIVAGADHQKPLLTTLRHKGGVGHAQLQPDQQAGTAHILNNIGVLVFQFSQPLGKITGSGPDTLKKCRVRHHIKHGIANRHRQRVPP